MIESLTTAQLLLAVATLLAAYFVRGIAGFGSALVAVPLLSLLFPVTVVVPVVILLDYLGSLSHGLHHRTRVLWREIVPLTPFTLSGILVGLHLLKTVEPGALTTALGLFVILYALYSLLPVKPTQGSRLWAAPLGFCAGVIGTAFGTGGPFIVIYLTLRQLDKQSFRATIAVIFFLDGGMRLAGYTFSGFYTPELLWWALLSIPLAALGMWLGGHIHTGLSQQRFVQIVSVVLLGSGSALLLRSLGL